MATSINLRGNSSNNGEFVLQPPNSAANRTLDLPDESAELLTSLSNLSADNFINQIDPAQMPADSIIQTKQEVSTSRTRFSSGTRDVDPAINITPQFSDSRILVMHTAGGMIDGTGRSIGFGLKRNGSFVWASSRYGYHSNGNWNYVPFHCSYIDSPNTTSSITYRFTCSNETGNDFRHNDGDGSFWGGTRQAITIAMEIRS